MAYSKDGVFFGAVDFNIDGERHIGMQFDNGTMGVIRNLKHPVSQAQLVQALLEIVADIKSS